MTQSTSGDALVEYYDFRSIITEDDDRQACDIVRSIIDSGQYFTNSPKFQTKENIFARTELVWLKYRMSFLMSVFLYLGKEARVGSMMAWSFMTNIDIAEDRNKLWHNHWHPSNPGVKRMLSGVWYLHIPDDAVDKSTCGTEIAPNGVAGTGKYYTDARSGNWVIYPSETWHRPGIIQSSEHRFVLAADVEIY